MSPFYFGDYDNSQSDSNQNPEYSLIMDFDNSRVILQHNRDFSLNQFFYFSDISGLVSSESGAFTVSANGATATINGASAGSNWSYNSGTGIGTLTIATTRKLKSVSINTAVAGQNSSLGTDNGTHANSLTGLSWNYSDFDNSIYVEDAENGNGWSGKITTINSTSFIITLTRIGTGLNLNAQWIALMGN